MEVIDFLNQIPEQEFIQILNDFNRSITQMYQKLLSVPTQLVKTIQITVVDDVNDERTQLIFTNYTTEDNSICKNQLFHMFLTRDNARDYEIYEFQMNESSVLIKQTTQIYANSVSDIKIAIVIYERLNYLFSRFPHIYTHNEQLVNTMISRLLCVDNNTPDYNKAVQRQNRKFIEFFNNYSLY